MHKTKGLIALMAVVALIAAACGDDGDDGANGGGNGDGTTPVAVDIDYESIGLWDDGPCDESLPPLIVGTQAVFESPVISLGDIALALEASAVAFNERGGANGHCIEVHTCDDGANLDQAVACVRTLEAEGVVAYISDTTTAGNDEVSAALEQAGIPRVATNVTPSDWAAPNAFPIDASSTGLTLLLPQGLIAEDVLDIGVIRADLAEASALIGLLEGIYEDQGATFPVDLPVPAGTTDYTQFILGSEQGGAEGVILAVGEQEGVQVLQAASDLGSDLVLGSSLGSFPYSVVADMGELAQNMVFVSSYPPAMMDVPAYEALRADLAASGEELLQPENLKVTPMRAWIGMYALLQMIRETGLTDFTRENITAMLNEATDVPMLDIFGGEDWTPSHERDALFTRAGTDHWGVYRWDPDATAPTGSDGNFVEVATISFDEVLCGSPLGAPEPC